MLNSKMRAQGDTRSMTAMKDAFAMSTNTTTKDWCCERQTLFTWTVLRIVEQNPQGRLLHVSRVSECLNK
eukprot:6194513-Pleurochrysis_carterae.AAC.1